MLSLTAAAAEQIRLSISASEADGLPLRVAVLVKSDGAFHYAIGFEDRPKDEDVRFKVEGIDLVIAPASAGNLKGMTIDFVELEPGKPQFIFLNPNDPEYVAPVQK